LFFFREVWGAVAGRGRDRTTGMRRAAAAHAILRHVDQKKTVKSQFHASQNVAFNSFLKSFNKLRIFIEDL
jgi:hypothetical protein